jgi:Tol biopolymer transport system component
MRSAVLHPPDRRLARALRCLLMLPLSAAGCADAVVALGDRDPPRYHFGAPELVVELSDPVAKTDNPSLTSDLRQIFFTSERSGGPAEIWTATRADASQSFGTPELASALNSQAVETSPIVSADGLTMWLGSDRAGGLGDLDIWVSTRSSRTASWSKPENLAALNSVAKDIPRPPGQHGLVMPLGSDREERGFYAIYFATRQNLAAHFTAPELVTELASRTASAVDAFLTDDGTALFFVSGPAFGPADLYVSARRSIEDPFSEPAPLEDLNTSNDERDPWLSADGKQLYFSSDRSGHYEIYVASVTRDPP